MRNVVVADTKVHAKAVISWLKLDESWIPMQFGAFVDQDYGQVRLVRPASGVTSEHYAWITHTLMQRVRGEVGLVPPQWIEVDDEGEIGINALVA